MGQGFIFGAFAEISFFAVEGSVWGDGLNVDGGDEKVEAGVGTLVAEVHFGVEVFGFGIDFGNGIDLGDLLGVSLKVGADFRGISVKGQAHLAPSCERQKAD